MHEKRTTVNRGISTAEGDPRPDLTCLTMTNEKIASMEQLANEVANILDICVDSA